MATFASVLSPTGAATNQSVAASTAGTAVKLGNNVKYAITADQDMNVVFYSSAGGSVTPSSSVGFRLFAKTLVTLDMGEHLDTVNFFNLSGTTAANVSIQQFATS